MCIINKIYNNGFHIVSKYSLTNWTSYTIDTRCWLTRLSHSGQASSGPVHSQATNSMSSPDWTSSCPHSFALFNRQRQPASAKYWLNESATYIVNNEQSHRTRVVAPLIETYTNLSPIRYAIVLYHIPYYCIFISANNCLLQINLSRWMCSDIFWTKPQ